MGTHELLAVCLEAPSSSSHCPWCPGEGERRKVQAIILLNTWLPQLLDKSICLFLIAETLIIDWEFSQKNTLEVTINSHSNRNWCNEVVTKHSALKSPFSFTVVGFDSCKHFFVLRAHCKFNTSKWKNTCSICIELWSLTTDHGNRYTHPFPSGIFLDMLVHREKSKS